LPFSTFLWPNPIAEKWHNISNVRPAEIDKKAAKPVKENVLDRCTKPRIE
jgi:hypothetical protein